MTVLPHPTRQDDRLDAEYRESLSWLYRQSRAGAPRDPKRMSRLVAALDLEFPPHALHVVGTNGKGTVTSMCAAALSASGRRTGSFISPHVEEFQERIAVDGEPIPRAEVVAFVERVRSVALPFRPAFFELTLAMALAHFQACRATFVTFEAGVGAKRDSTAVLEGVEAVAITPIALDHLATLGPGLADIARDKAAAMRERLPVASAAQEPEVRAVLREEAMRRGCELHLELPESPLFELPAGLANGSDPVRSRNQRLAAATLRLLGGVTEAAIASGLAIPPLPARGERFQLGAVTVLLDGAHDPAAGRALVSRVGQEDYVLLFGSLGRKQGEATLRELEKGSSATFVTRAGAEPATVERTDERTFLERPRDALLAALAACPPGGLLVIAGSLYLAGELRPLLRELEATATEV